jgi:hypothetical protein
MRTTNKNQETHTTPHHLSTHHTKLSMVFIVLKQIVHTTSDVLHSDSQIWCMRTKSSKSSSKVRILVTIDLEAEKLSRPTSGPRTRAVHVGVLGCQFPG